jgi:hypothetical protein
VLDFLTAPFANGPGIAPGEVLVRLVLALVFGGIVAWVYRRTRLAVDISPTFPPTLVLLAILIAMVTQVIGDNVARAFSLVGALSIVRFRTVVRDTQDTAFVIFAVVVGMAVGAQAPAIPLVGIAVVSLAAFLMRPRASSAPGGAEARYRLEVRMASGQDLNGQLGAALDAHLIDRRLISIGTARQGMSLNVLYAVRIRAGTSAEELVRALNRVEGVQGVELAIQNVVDPSL